MSTHNMFSSRNKKNIDNFWLKKAPYQELWPDEMAHNDCLSLCFFYF